EHEMEIPVLEIADATVDETRRSARRAGREVAFVDQGDREPAHGGVARDAGTGDTAADDENVERAPGQFVEESGSVEHGLIIGKGERGIGNGPTSRGME